MFSLAHMLELTQVRRKKNGRYKKAKFYNKNRRVWFEVMCLANIAIWGAVAADLNPIAEAYYLIPDKIEIIREPSKVPAHAARTQGNHDATVTTVADIVPRESSEGGKDINTPVPSSEVEDKILKAWEGTGEGHIALAVAKSESGLNPNAKGDIPIQFWHKGKLIGHSCGIFQIRVLEGRPDCETLKDVDKNIEFAKKLYDKSGFYPWSNWKNNTYLKFL